MPQEAAYRLRDLECIEDNFSIYVSESPNRVVLLHPLLNNSELKGEVKTAGSLDCSDHVLLEFIIWRDTG